jgi:hypothetical protein
MDAPSGCWPSTVRTVSRVTGWGDALDGEIAGDQRAVLPHPHALRAGEGDLGVLGNVEEVDRGDVLVEGVDAGLDRRGVDRDGDAQVGDIVTTDDDLAVDDLELGGLGGDAGAAPAEPNLREALIEAIGLLREGLRRRGRRGERADARPSKVSSTRWEKPTRHVRPRDRFIEVHALITSFPAVEPTIFALKK